MSLFLPSIIAVCGHSPSFDDRRSYLTYLKARDVVWLNGQKEEASALGYACHCLLVPAIHLLSAAKIAKANGSYDCASPIALSRNTHAACSLTMLLRRKR